MRIALLTWDYPPVPTGLGRAAGEISHGLASSGCDVTVMTMDRSGVETSARTGIRVVGCGGDEAGTLAWLRKRACAGHLAAPRIFAAAVKAEADRNGPFDVIETTNWYAPGLFLTGNGPASVVRNSTPAIDARDPSASLRDRTDLRFAHALERRTARNADALISNADHHRRLIDGIYGLKGTRHEVIPLSIDPQLVSKGEAAPAPDTGSPPTFLFVGRAERRKGFDEVLGAFALFAEIAPGARLICVGLGEGALDDRLGALGLGKIRNRIEDLGRASDEAMHAAFCESAIVVAPSRYESFGLVYREAAAYGRPLIACAEDPSATDLLAEEDFGVLAPDCSSGAIAETMMQLVAGDGRRVAMRQAGLAYAKGLSREALGRATLAVYADARKRAKARAR